MTGAFTKVEQSGSQNISHDDDDIYCIYCSNKLSQTSLMIWTSYLMLYFLVLSCRRSVTLTWGWLKVWTPCCRWPVCWVDSAAKQRHLLPAEPNNNPADGLKTCCCLLTASDSSVSTNQHVFAADGPLVSVKTPSVALHWCLWSSVCLSVALVSAWNHSRHFVFASGNKIM